MAAPSAPGVQFAAAFGAQPVPQATNRNADIMSLFQQAPPVAAMQQQQQHFQKAAMHQQQQFNQFQQPQQFSAGFGAFAQQQQPAASSGFGAFQQPQQQQQPMRPVQQQQQPPQPFANTNAGGWGAFQ